jgi:hypothetical protein
LGKVGETGAIFSERVKKGSNSPYQKGESSIDKDAWEEERVVFG